MKKSKKVFSIVMTVVAIASIITLGITLWVTELNRRKTQTKLNAVYEKSYYEVLDETSDIEVKLSKFSVLNGNELRCQLLSDVWRQSELAASNLSQLGTESEDLDKIIKFLNQLGDYSFYLSRKLSKGGITDEEKANVDKMYAIVKELNDALEKSRDKLIASDKIDGSILSDMTLINDSIKSHSSVDYPELIYDGPFSDGLNDREAKFLKDKADITEEQATNKVKEYFPSANNIEKIGESNTSIPAFIYSFDLGRNVGTLQISKVGGYVVSYNAYCLVDDPQLSEEECVQNADEYLRRLGYENMKAVWVSNDDSTVYINYAYYVDDIIVYPDLVKVKICSQTGDLIGVEAENYLYNHVERTLTKTNTAIRLDDRLTVTGQNYCLIPTEWNTEIMAKEIVASYDGTEYYIYYDLESGEEIKALIVVEDNGRALI